MNTLDKVFVALLITFLMPITYITTILFLIKYGGEPTWWKLPVGLITVIFTEIVFCIIVFKIANFFINKK